MELLADSDLPKVARACGSTMDVEDAIQLLMQSYESLSHSVGTKHPAVAGVLCQLAHCHLESACCACGVAEAFNCADRAVQILEECGIGGLQHTLALETRSMCAHAQACGF